MVRTYLVLERQSPVQVRLRLVLALPELLRARWVRAWLVRVREPLTLVLELLCPGRGR